MKYIEVTEKIIGCAYRVYNKLGFGFLESIYEKALSIELKKTGLTLTKQQRLKVIYDEIIIGEFIADIIVNDTIILELKSVQLLVSAHEQQLVNYLTATNIDVGLLINFGPTKVEIKRKVRKLPENPREDIK